MSFGFKYTDLKAYLRSRGLTEFNLSPHLYPMSSRTYILNIRLAWKICGLLLKIIFFSIRKINEKRRLKFQYNWSNKYLLLMYSKKDRTLFSLPFPPPFPTLNIFKYVSVHIRIFPNEVHAILPKFLSSVMVPAQTDKHTHTHTHRQPRRRGMWFRKHTSSTNYHRVSKIKKKKKPKTVNV